MATEEELRNKLAELLEAGEPRGDSTALIHYLIEVCRCYQGLKEFRLLLPYRKRLVELQPNAVHYNNYAVCCVDTGYYRDVLPYYRRALEAERRENTSSIIYSNLIRYVADRGTFDAALHIQLLPRTYSASLEYIIGLANACVQYGRLDGFRLTNGLVISKDCDDYEKHSVVKTIFDATADLPNKHKVRALLVALYANVTTIKNGHRANLCWSGGEIGHYTRVENLKHLVKRGGDTYLHLYNVAYMNDPSEGKVFDRLLEEFGAVSRKHSDPECERLGRRCRSYGYSNTYLGSFSASIDSLPMWVQYGNGGQGCCLIFPDDFFDEDEPFLTPPPGVLAAQEPEEGEAKPPAEERYVLYEVSYISQVEEYHYSDNLRAIADLYTQIGTVLDSLSNPDIIQLLSGYVESILDQIRFLYKEPDYSHEQEYRIVKWADQPLCDEGMRSGEVPHLYINLERPLRYKEIILGPKLEHPSTVAPYLYYTEKVDRVTQSTIRYQ